MNIQKLMKQAQQMQSKAAAVQEELQTREFDASVGGDKVKVVANGAGDVLSIKIDPAVVDPEDVAFLEDLVLKCIQEATGKAKAVVSEEMGKITGGLGIPGL